MFGINSAEFFVILFVGLIVAGPSGLRTAFQSFRSFVAWAQGLSKRLRLSTQDLRELDSAAQVKTGTNLSRYNPSEIIRQAVREETQAWIRQLEGREKHT